MTTTAITAMVTRGLALLVFAAMAMVGCAGSAHPSKNSASATTTTATTTLRSAVASPQAEAITVELRSPPKQARWISATLGPTRPTLGILVTNQSLDAHADVSNLRTHLEAVREGVSFRCEQDVGAEFGAREPTSLAPGAAYLFERSLDCSLPLVGNYTVSIAVSFGEETSRRRSAVVGTTRRVARTFTFTFTLAVRAPEHSQPKPIQALPGVWAAIGASSLIVGDAGRGSGRIAVAVINGGPTAVAIPRPVQLALRVYREGSPIPCVDVPVDLAMPAVLEPGGSHRQPIDVSCLGLGMEGRYDVSARLLLGGEGNVLGESEREIELGRLQIAISNDPVRRISPSPLLLPALPPVSR